MSACCRCGGPEALPQTFWAFVPTTPAVGVVGLCGPCLQAISHAVMATMKEEPRPARAVELLRRVVTVGALTMAEREEFAAFLALDPALAPLLGLVASRDTEPPAPDFGKHPYLGRPPSPGPMAACGHCGHPHTLHRPAYETDEGRPCLSTDCLCPGWVP